MLYSEIDMIPKNGSIIALLKSFFQTFEILPSLKKWLIFNFRDPAIM